MAKSALRYPRVLTEFDTLACATQDKSLARYGDGEFNLVKGGNCISQKFDRAIQKELAAILTSKTETCLVCIPTMDKSGPKADRWRKYEREYSRFLNPGKIYGSAFVTRPDSAPWIATDTYFDSVEALWKGKDVALVHCGERSLVPAHLVGVKSVYSILCPRRDAYEYVDALEAAVLSTGVKVAILCAGPTATCLAHRLSKKGVQAIDLGHIGMFWRRTELYQTYG